MKLVNLEKLLPADLPRGEKVLWRGRPDWVSLTRHAFRGDLVAAYFVAMAGWNFVVADGAAAGAAAALTTLGAGAASVALLALLAWLSARTTLYLITSKRVVMKIGVALPAFFNLPFAQIESASIHRFADGSDDIPLALKDHQRLAYLHLWPHARPLKYAEPQPTLRSIPQASQAADILARALLAACAPGEGALGAAALPANAPPRGANGEAANAAAA